MLNANHLTIRPAQFRILVIDDDPVIQIVLKRTLEDQGYQVTIAPNGEEGIIQAQQLSPALIICDWLMSGISGLEVCRRIKADPTLSTTFFILLTSRNSIADRVKGLDTGADDFLPKPIEANELKARVRAGLRLYQSAQELQKLAQDLQTQKQILETELAEAADYVKSLLPAPLSDPEVVSIETQFLPSRQLGGDCFDYYWLDPDYLAIYVLDMSGHGLGSALPSVYIQNILRSQSLSGINFYQPSEVLRGLNEIFQMSNQNARYFTIWYGVYNRKKRQLTYASAGHPPAILIWETTPQMRQLRTRGMPIGMMTDSKFTHEVCTVESNSALYIFSDGIYEIKQADGGVWDLTSFIDLLLECHRQNYQLEEILQTIRDLHQTQTFEDDCSLIRVQLH
jgi:phosphoserine phosphatase RsbU/P